MMDLRKFVDLNSFDEEERKIDTTFWRIPYGVSTVRLLPNKSGVKPFFHLKVHRYVHEGNYIVANCPRTWDESCPVCGIAWEWYQSGDPVLIEKAKALRARHTYFFNIYIIDDPEVPENNGKVKVMSVGVKLFDLIKEYSKNEEYGVKIFDPVDGFNFIIKKTKRADYPSYDGTMFSRTTSPVTKDEAELKAIWEARYDLAEVAIRETAESIGKKFYFLFDRNITTDVKIPPAKLDKQDVKNVEVDVEEDQELLKKLESLLDE